MLFKYVLHLLIRLLGSIAHKLFMVPMSVRACIREFRRRVFTELGSRVSAFPSLPLFVKFRFLGV